MHRYHAILTILFFTLSCGERSGSKQTSSPATAMNHHAMLAPLAVPCPASISTFLKGPNAPNHCDVWGDKITVHFELGEGIYTLSSLSAAKDTSYNIGGTSATIIEIADGIQFLGQDQDVGRKILTINDVKELRVGNQVRMEQVALVNIDTVKVGDSCQFSHVQIDKGGSYQFGSAASMVDVKIDKVTTLQIGSKPYFELTKLNQINSLIIGNHDQTISIDLTAIRKATFPNTKFWREQASSLKLANSSFSYTLQDN